MWPTVRRRRPKLEDDDDPGAPRVTGRESPSSTLSRRYRHDAFLYDSAQSLADVAAPFLLDGLAAGEAAVVATSAGAADVLRDAVDGDPRVHVLERHDVYRARTPTAITTFRRLAEEYAAAGINRVRVVGEVDFGPTERDWLEWQRYEAVINEALAAWPLWGLCVFDTQRLPDLRARVRPPDAHRPGHHDRAPAEPPLRRPGHVRPRATRPR